MPKDDKKGTGTRWDGKAGGISSGTIDRADGNNPRRWIALEFPNDRQSINYRLTRACAEDESGANL